MSIIVLFPNISNFAITVIMPIMQTISTVVNDSIEIIGHIFNFGIFCDMFKINLMLECNYTFNFTSLGESFQTNY